MSRIAHLMCELAVRMRAAGVGNRVLRALRNEGLIRLKLRSLHVLDWDGLCSLGDFNQRYLHPALESGAAAAAG